jgi:signal transduction histidine kinase
MGMEDIKPRIESARRAAERAQLHAQAALVELEAVRLDATTEQVAAERGQRMAEAAQLAAEAAQLAAEAARDAAESARDGAEAAAQEAELAQRNLQDFLAMAAHDIRGPLAAIAGYTDLLSIGNMLMDERERALDAIQSAVTQMDRLVEDIVDAGRLGAGAFHLRPEPLDLVSLVKRVASGQQGTSDRHRVLVDAPERLDGEWDPERLGQVMTNLISNAIKYSPAGGDVRIRVRREGDAAVVSIADQGTGIRAAYLPLLFRPFTRLLSPEEQVKVNGTGLGLYISYGIVQAHGGSIWATSHGPDTGSEFSVRLPLGRATASMVPT